MRQYIFRKIGNSEKTERKPFAIIPYEGTGLAGGPNFTVSDGICYSTFSYNSGTYVPVSNIGTPFVLQPDSAVYIDFTVLANLQISGAQVKISAVGKDAINKQADIPTEWIDYPDYYRIRPGDIMENGIVKTFVDGKRQEKAYLLLGKCTTNIEEARLSNYPFTTVKNDSPSQPQFYFIQYASNDIIMMASWVSGVEVVFPFPFWGGPSTSNATGLAKLNN